MSASTHVVFKSPIKFLLLFKLHISFNKIMGECCFFMTVQYCSLNCIFLVDKKRFIF